MSLLLYAIAEAGREEIAGAGLSEHPLREIGDDRLVAVVSEHERPPRTLEPAHLRAYESALERVMERGAMLPARFGTVLADARAARSVLSERRAELTARLAAVRGAVELAVRVSPPVAAEETYRSGSAYMQARLADWHRAAETARALRPLDEFAREVHAHGVAGAGSALRMSYLVDRRRVEAFTALVARLDAGLPDMSLVCTGPWPPFSFAGGPRP